MNGLKSAQIKEPHVHISSYTSIRLPIQLTQYQLSNLFLLLSDIARNYTILRRLVTITSLFTIKKHFEEIHSLFIEI